MSYELYYYPGNASLAPHLVLEELGADYRLLLVDRNTEAQKSAEYLALNPAGRIPVLVDRSSDRDIDDAGMSHSHASHSDKMDDAFVISESAAICWYIAEQEGGLLPASPRLKALCHQWLMYLTNTVQAELMIYFYPHNHLESTSGIERLKLRQEQRITEMFAFLDQEMKKNDNLFSERISVCDFYLLMLCVWARGFLSLIHI